jgi:AcrR family transcriptional regulator
LPKIVDYDKRREWIIDGYLGLVQSNFPGPATSRNLAKHLGISNSLLWRYFDGMDDLLAQVYLTVVERTNRRISESISQRHGVDAVKAMLDELLPLTVESRVESQVVVAFWGRSATSPTNTASVGLTEMNVWTTLMARLVEDAVNLGQISVSENVSTADLAELLVSSATSVQIEYAIRRDSRIVRRRRELMISFFLPETS